jgi:alkanesulfonate monooxygenase SsuD/methylene tetrahydromethanopterin reductase-like flavin-dependent oxidoreductase (luciferase family)
MVMATSRIRIAVDAVPAFLLPPFGWSKYFASLDVISGGRIIVGMCLGFGEENFRTVGLRQKDRAPIADEQLEVVTRLWTEDDVTHRGRYYRLEGVTIDPKPIQKPHPPIWWGGRQKSIPRAARYCEFINTLWPTRAEVRDEYLPALERECAKWGTHTRLASWFYCRLTERDMSLAAIDEWFGGLMEMEVAVVPHDVTLAGSPEQFARAVKSYRDAGMDHFVLDFQRHGLEDHRATLAQMEDFAGKVAPLL